MHLLAAWKIRFTRYKAPTSILTDCVGNCKHFFRKNPKISRRGDPVNLETDVVGKYIEKLLRPEETKPHTPANESTLTKEMLLRCGF